MEIKNHVFFSVINWDDLINKKITPPFNPNVVSIFLLNIGGGAKVISLKSDVVVVVVVERGRPSRNKLVDIVFMDHFFTTEKVEYLSQQSSQDFSTHLSIKVPKKG